MAMLAHAEVVYSIEDAKKNSRHTAKEVPETTLTPAQVEDILVKARVHLLISAPFFGSMATRLRFIDATNWCPTAGTDGRNFYYNRNFVAALAAKSPKQVVYLVGHEVLHCVYGHMNKDWLGKRNAMLANIAQDYVINLDLDDANIGEKIDLVDICYDWKYRGKIWEEVYDELFEEAKEKGQEPGDGQGQTLDIHMDGSEGGGDGDGDQSGEGGGQENDGKDGPIQYTEDELSQIESEVRDATVQAAKSAGAGSLPGGVKRIVDGLLNPQIDWRELLAMQIQSILKSNYNFMKPSRKGLDAGYWLPGMDNDQTIDIAIAIDTSGSIDNVMMKDFISEVYGIMSQYTDFKVHLWCFDTAVHNPVVITADTIQDFDNYELAGFGGTTFECNWEYMKDNDIEPKKFVMFTDGYPCRGWGDEFYCETLFIVHGGGYGKPPTAPFGITVPYSTEEGAGEQRAA